MLESVEEGVWQRRFADVVRLEVDDAMPPRVLDILAENLKVHRNDIYQLRGPVALSRLRHLWSVDRPVLKDPPFSAATPSALEPEDKKEDTCLADAAKARHMQPDGSYLRDADRSVERAMNSQEWLIDRVVSRSAR
ncbi:MAG TPA: hypothetical protein VGV15_17020 [Terriglobales bacterium]|nr:hypothetical protein [Terriglobales bacterium]